MTENRTGIPHDAPTHETVPPAATVDSLQERVAAAGDTLVSLLHLFRLEVSQTLASLPALVGLVLVKVPLLLLAWVSLGVVVALPLHSLTGSALLGGIGFFCLQLLALAVVEWLQRKIARRCGLPETRKNVGLAAACIQESLHNVRSGS